MMDAFATQFERDRAIIVHCIKCNVPLARLEVKAVYKIAMYVCEQCFFKLEKGNRNEKESINA